jgi:hypothetical protein
MKGRDLIKTIVAVLIIGGIIVATFLYGNRQRQDQVRRDEEIARQQEERAQPETEQNQAATQATPPPAQPQTQSQTPSPTPAPASQPAATPPPAPQVATAIPDTGSELLFVIPAGLMFGLYRINRTQKRAVRQALSRP